MRLQWVYYDTLRPTKGRNMRLFISYARVDQRFCTQLLDLLEAHEWWYDQRLWAGEQWWQKIMEEIDKCDALLFLLSPDSLRSKWCMEEYKIAREQGKLIIPIQIEPCDAIPQDLLSRQFVNMQQGFSISAVRELLNALMIAERRILSKVAIVGDEKATPKVSALSPHLRFSPETFTKEVTQSYEQEDYETTIFLLTQALEHFSQPTALDLKAWLKEAHLRLERKAYQQHLKHEYDMIAETLKYASTRKMGLEALQKFRQQYPDYDPKGLNALIIPMLIPSLTWCEIPEGEVTLEFPERKRTVTYFVTGYQISKFPITNAQFQIFVDAPDGYADTRWWDYSQEATEWRKTRPKALPPRIDVGDHPRVNVTFYEARAFCVWLSYKTGWQISLPTEEQWQRAAQGDDGRQYPWGNRYLYQYCNGQDSKINHTTRVGQFAKGASPYGVMDLSGNVWEWCRNRVHGTNKNPYAERVTKGGSYSSHYKRIRVTARLAITPSSTYGTLGFRVVVNRR